MQTQFMTYRLYLLYYKIYLGLNLKFDNQTTKLLVDSFQHVLRALYVFIRNDDYNNVYFVKIKNIEWCDVCW